LLLIAISWVVLSFCFLGWGKLVSTGFGPPDSRQDFSESGYFFMGVSLAGILSGIWWMFAPVNEIFGGFLLGIGIGYAVASLPFRLEISFKSRWFLASIALFFMALIMKAAAPTSFYDCGLYYVQTVRWIQQYPVVPGLANLHIRFGNASAWHMLSAAFDWKSIFQGSFDDLGELLLLWFLLFHSWNVLKLEGFERYLSLGLIFFAVWQSQNLVTAPSPDLAAGVLGMQTLWQFRKFLRLWNPREPNQLNTRGLALFIQSLFLAQIKLSAIPFLIIAAVVIFLVVREGWYLRVSQLLFLGICVAISMVFRSYYLTGFVVFPVWQGGLSPDWLVPEVIVKGYVNGVKGFARHFLTVQELSLGMTYDQYGLIPFSEWFPIWAKERRWEDWICMISGVTGWLLLVRYASTNIRKSFRSFWPLIFFTWLAGMMMLFWFSNAPDVRFGMAILGNGFSYTIATLGIWIEPVFKSAPHRLIRNVSVIGVALWAIWLYRDTRSLMNQRIFPPPYQKIEIETFSLNMNKKIYKPKSVQTNWYVDRYQCWDAPLPCSPVILQGVEFRGKTVKDGFRSVKK